MSRKQKKRRPGKRAALFFLFLLGGAMVLAFFSLPLPGTIPILMYHFVVPHPVSRDNSLEVSAKNFERQMWFLRTLGYRPISAADFEAVKKKERKPRGREVLVTFDDGNETYLTYALPVLERYQIPSINFLIWNELTSRDHGSMTLKQAKTIAGNPLVTLGSHTLTHPTLSTIPIADARTEIFESKRLFEREFGRPFDYFCYPKGDFNEEVMRLTREAGYQLAFTVARKRLKDAPETLHSVARIKIGPKDHLLIFWYKVSGLGFYISEGKRMLRQLTGFGANGKLNDYHNLGYAT